MSGQFWGSWFPRAFWGSWFEGGPADPGLAPAGAAAFVLEEEATLTLVWRTGLFKSYSGLERRSNLLDDPAQRQDGSALLVGRDSRATRAKLARNAAEGKAFSLGLAFESVPVSADSTGTTVHVDSTTMLDWAVYGGRVIVRRRGSDDKYTSVETVITAVTANTIEVAAAIGTTGLLGAEIMPTLASFLDAQQAFARSRPAEPIERWGIKARAAIAGFAAAAKTATLPLTAPLTTGVIQGLTIRARAPGAAGNTITITQTDDAVVAQGLRSDNLTTGHIVIKYKAGATTVAQYIALVNGSTLVYVDGAFTGTDVLAAGVNTFAAGLSGGADLTPAQIGRGANVTIWAGAPVWDRGVDVQDTVVDSMQAMTVTQDLGALPWSAGTASSVDWGRALSYSRTSRAEWQWIKRFLWTIAGRWKSWWLPSFRADLLPVSVGVGTLTIQSGEDAGDFFAWYATQSRIQCRSSSGAVTYAHITNALDNHDGTITLTLVDGAGAPLSLGVVPALVSWLDLVRLDSDEVAVRLSGRTFAVSLQARVMRQPAQGPIVTFDDYEASVEQSQPREGIEVILPMVTHRIATGTRDVVIGGATFRAEAVGREEAAIATTTEDTTLIVRLPVSHPAVVRYLKGGIPPRRILVNLWRHQSPGDETLWQGLLVSLACDDQVALLRVAPYTMSQTTRRIPMVTVGRACPHVLYDRNCRADRSLFMVTGTVTSYDGRIVHISTIGGQPDRWARGGELLHTASGERMTVLSQVGTTITCQAQIQELVLGDTIELFAGCDHTVDACLGKFNNMANYGGFPNLPTARPFAPGKGLGIVAQP